MKINRIFHLPAIAALLALIPACSSDVDYTPASKPTGPQVYFSTEAQSSFDVDEGQNEVDVEVIRVDTKGALTVDLASYAIETAEGESSSEEVDIFTVPSSVTFAEGEASAKIKIGFNFDELRAETQYKVVIDLLGTDVNPYGKTQQTVSIQYAPWTPWELVSDGGIGTYIFAGIFSGYVQVPVMSRHSMLTPTNAQYIVNLGLDGIYGAGNDMIINLDETTGICRVPIQNTGQAYNGQQIKYCDTYTFFSSVAVGDEAEYEGKSFYDPNTGKFTLNLVYYAPAEDNRLSIFGDGLDNIETLQLPGYPDYEMLISNAGSYINEAGQEFMIIDVVKGEDIGSYACEIEAAALTPEQIAAKVEEIASAEDVTLYTESRAFQFPVTADEGFYTVVIVKYNTEGERAGSDSYTFYNEKAGTDWNKGWTTVTKRARFYDVFFTNTVLSGMQSPISWDVEVQQSDDMPGVYRMVKPYGSNAYGDILKPQRGHFYVTIDARDDEEVVVLPSLTCIDGIYVASSESGEFYRNKFIFQGNSLGVVAVDSVGEPYVISGWDNEATLLDLAPAQSGPAGVAPRKADRRFNGGIQLRSNLPTSLLLPCDRKGKPARTWLEVLTRGNMPVKKVAARSHSER